MKWANSGMEELPFGDILFNHIRLAKGSETLRVPDEGKLFDPCHSDSWTE